MKRLLCYQEIYLLRENIDFRKSINGLAAIMENDTGYLSEVTHCSCSPTNSSIKSKCCTEIKQTSHYGINNSKKQSINNHQKRKMRRLP